MKSKIRIFALWLVLTALAITLVIGILEIGRMVGQVQMAVEYTCTPRTATSNIRDDRGAPISTNTTIKLKGQNQ